MVAPLAERECEAKDGEAANDFSFVKIDCFPFNAGSASSPTIDEGLDWGNSEGGSLSEASRVNCTLGRLGEAEVPGNDDCFLCPNAC